MTANISIAADESGRHGQQAREGFTLIEVLVAMAIVAISLSVIYAGFSVALQGRRAADDYEQATLFAESKLATVGAGGAIDTGTSSGDFNDRFHWELSVNPYTEEGGNSTGTPLDRPYVVAITVSWGSDRSKSISLQTLRLAP